MIPTLLSLFLFMSGAFGTQSGTAYAAQPSKPKLGPALKAVDYVLYGEARLRGMSTQSVMKMDIRRPSFTRSLRIRSWSRGSDHAMVEILDPVKEEGVSSLRNEGEMWNYLPKTDQVVRVPTSLMLQSWMGSDFTNDDLMKASSLARDYRHTIMKYGMLGKERVVQIQCIPKPNAPVVWGKILYFARTSDKLPVREAFYDEKGKLVRTLFMDRFKKMDDRVVPSQLTVRMADGSGGMTVITYEKIVYDREVSESIFSRDQLRKNAQEGKVITAGWMFNHLPSSWFH